MTPHLSCCHLDASLSHAVGQMPLHLFSSLWLKQKRDYHKLNPNLILCLTDKMQPQEKKTKQIIQTVEVIKFIIKMKELEYTNTRKIKEQSNRIYIYVDV